MSYFFFSPLFLIPYEHSFYSFIPSQQCLLFEYCFYLLHILNKALSLNIAFFFLMVQAAVTFTIYDLTFSYLASDSCFTEWNSTRVGRLVGSEGKGDVAVPIDIGLGPCKESDQFLNSFSHQTYLPIWFIIDDPSTFTILHQSFSSTLADYISYLKSQNISPVSTYQFPNYTQYKYVSEEYRMLVRKLVCFVMHLHSLGKSLVKLSVDNLCILNGELKIWGLRFKRKDHISFQRDFKFVYKVTKKIFCLGGFVIGKKATEKLPDDFDDVITMMRLFKSRYIYEFYYCIVLFILFNF